ncbi:hypothetical protein TNCV_625041 [Trichonephila clavipes]|nr:hypothetical protein TNCV_625041 [Trichonephila clavipes]
MRSLSTSGKLSFLDVPPLQPHPLRSRSGHQRNASPHRRRKTFRRRSRRNRSESFLAHPPPLAISKTRLLWRKESSAEESSVEIASAKPAKPVIAQSSPAAKAAESASAPGTSKKDDGFTTVGRNGKRIAPIVIDAQSNATELLTQIGNLCSNSSLQGRFENGKLRVFPTSAEEHRIIQKFVSDKKMRSHTFEMAHNKQLKVVLRGLPTDYNQDTLMSELHLALSPIIFPC